jgi:NAD(P)-dependent dehydrogenase (short-subunit alcohol dehydrogenase family)
LQLVLITGGAKRIGKAIAVALATSGFSVALQYHRSEAEAEETVKELQQLGAAARSFRASLEEPGQMQALVESINRAMGPIACLINNASHFVDDRLGALTAESWSAHFSINLESPIFLAQAFAAQLPAGVEGAIVNIIDQRVLRPNPLFFSYTLSKSALWAATRTMAQALAPRIRVNAIGPGPALKNVYQSEDDFRHEWDAMPLGHGTTPDEIAQAVLFILRSPAMTGQMIALDGGQHLLWQTPDIGVT